MRLDAVINNHVAGDPRFQGRQPSKHREIRQDRPLCQCQLQR